jgi:hypothetical protein
MRAIPQSACSSNDNTDDIRGILYYGDSASTPTTTGYTYTDSCEDEDLSDLVPYLSKTASAEYWSETETATVAYNSDNLFRWYLNDSTFQVEWDNPTLLQVYNNDTTFNTSNNVIQLSSADEWAYVIIQTSLAVPHPIHLHGHDFYILAQGTGTYDSSDIGSLTNPPRRDVALLPASGYLVLAWETDNPGAWLMHCHIGWHTDEGFALQFLERYSDIADLIDYDTLNSTCSAWDTYKTSNTVEELDSGV